MNKQQEINQIFNQKLSEIINNFILKIKQSSLKVACHYNVSKIYNDLKKQVELGDVVISVFENVGFEGLDKLHDGLDNLYSAMYDYTIIDSPKKLDKFIKKIGKEFNYE